MNFVSGKTKEEIRLVTSLQASVNSKPDNSIGPDTLVSFAQSLAPNLFPVDVTMYGCPTFVGLDVLPFDPDGPLKNWDWTISGSYSTSGQPTSILIANGKTICGSSSHAWLGYPDSVIYEKLDGTTGICRVMYDTEIPDRKNVKWAIGGAGLLDNFNPKAEGYCVFTDRNGVKRKYNDVWRLTNHTVLGVKGKWKYGVTLINKGDEKADGLSINKFIKDNFKFDYALKLDGGHIAARNGPSEKINTSQSQAYAIQFVR